MVALLWDALSYMVLSSMASSLRTDMREFCLEMSLFLRSIVVICYSFIRYKTYF